MVVLIVRIILRSADGRALLKLLSLSLDFLRLRAGCAGGAGCLVLLLAAAALADERFLECLLVALSFRGAAGNETGRLRVCIVLFWFDPRIELRIDP